MMVIRKEFFDLKSMIEQNQTSPNVTHHQMLELMKKKLVHDQASFYVKFKKFNADFYLNTHSDLRQHFGDNVHAAYNHYVNHGASEKRQGWSEGYENDLILQCNDELAIFLNETSLKHLTSDVFEKGVTVQLETFDYNYYLQHNDDLTFNDPMSAFEHYLRNGKAEGRLACNAGRPHVSEPDFLVSTHLQRVPYDGLTSVSDCLYRMQQTFVTSGQKKINIIACPPEVAQIKPDCINIFLTATESDKVPISWKEPLEHQDVAGVIVPLDYCKKAILNSGIKCKRIDVVPQPVFLPKSELVIKPFIFGIFGTYKPRKNIIELLEAVAEVNKVIPCKLRWHASMFYDGYQHLEQELREKFCNVLELTTGFISVDKKKSFYKSLDAYVFPSSSEGYSLTVREAAIFNVPLVISDIEAHHELKSIARMIPTDVATKVCDEGAGQIPVIKHDEIVRALKMQIESTNHTRTNELKKKLTTDAYELSLKTLLRNHYLVEPKKIQKKTCLVEFLYSIYPEDCGSKKLTNMIIDEMQQFGFEVHLVSTVCVPNEPWTREAIAYATSKNIKLFIFDSREKVSEFINKNHNNYGVIRCSYTEKIHSSRTNAFVILDTHDNLSQNDFVTSHLVHDIKTNSPRLKDVHYYSSLSPSSFNPAASFKNCYTSKTHNFYNNQPFSSDLIITLNKEEFDSFSQAAPVQSKVKLIHYALPTASYKKIETPSKFVVVLSINPFNIQAMHIFIEQVCPLLDDDVVIDVYGNIKQCFPDVSNSKLRFHGFVEKESDIYENALCSICPLVCGTGQKLKILQSHSYNVPCILYYKNSLDYMKHGQNCFIAHSMTELANLINEVAKDPTLATSMRCFKDCVNAYETSRLRFNNITSTLE